jgi:guanylate kinase
MKRGRVIVISGPSGVGKTCLYKRLLSEMSDTLQFSISATTRTPRANELNGIDYYFMNKDEFKEKIKKNEFVEWAEVYGNYYGTLKAEIDRITNCGKNCLLDVDVQGGLNISKALPQTNLIFIFPPSMKELKRRIMERNTDDKKNIKIRFKNARKEMSFSGVYQYHITNDDFERAYRELKELVLKLIA